MRYIVYDQKGEMFEVTAGKLDHLIVKLGWTFWHPDEKREVFNEEKIEEEDNPE